jgi:ElaB/YqjD/DUF883 family membrane-anchored ribosome-binding protein
MATPTTGSESGGRREFTSDPAQALESLKQEFSKVSGQVQDYLKDRAHHVGQTVQDQTSQASETFEESIRQNPLAAMGIAAGVGFGLSLLLMSRGRSYRRGRYGNGWAANQDLSDWIPRDISRKDFRRLKAAIRDGFEQTRSHVHDPALLERLSGALSSLLNSPAATSMASAGTRAARQFVDRLSNR